MSQEKVDKHKNDKKNKKQIADKYNRKQMLRKVGAWVVGLIIVGAIVAALAVTFVNMYQNQKSTQPDYSSTSKVIGDFSGILTEETTAEESTSEETTEASSDSEETESETTAAETTKQ